MTGEGLLKLVVGALTPEDVRRIKAAGGSNELKGLLGALVQLARLDGRGSTDVRVKLGKIREALRKV